MKKTEKTIKFKKNRRSQASVTLLFDAILGRPPSPTCRVCGGISGDEGPLNGRCTCNTAPKDQNKNLCSSCGIAMTVSQECVIGYPGYHVEGSRRVYCPVCGPIPEMTLHSGVGPINLVKDTQET